MRKLVILLCMVVAAASLGVGSGGFSSVGADRSVAVEVVGDKNAYMSIENLNDNDTIKIKDGQRDIDFVTVTNYFSDDVTFILDFKLDIGGVTAKHTNGQIREDVSPGGSFLGSVTLPCSSSTGDSVNANISFNLTAYGVDVSAKTTAERQVNYTLVCKNDDEEDDGDDDEEDDGDDDEEDDGDDDEEDDGDDDEEDDGDDE